MIRDLWNIWLKPGAICIIGVFAGGVYLIETNQDPTIGAAIGFCAVMLSAIINWIGLES